MDGKIVKVVKNGGVTYVFHDDYCKDKTEEEIKAILDRIAAIALPGLKAAYYKQINDEKGVGNGGE